MSAYFDRTVLHLVTITKWSTVRSRYADTNYYSANLKYAEGYAEDLAPKARHQCLPLNQLDGVSKLSQTYQNGGLSVRTSLPNPKKGGYCSREPLTASDHLRS